ncbi:hypothetical protein GCM10025867_03070 [Frondihabitans sucicola]|uniref:Uncharacterized protein n=1 Tax=Frondihabitans sucicola TaxID=1268041 RepID=A0ABM8GI67_9MICO|nr:hypothetical protein GCM10025867_03070 [Frondihabitans sucicola]
MGPPPRVNSRDSVLLLRASTPVSPRLQFGRLFGRHRRLNRDLTTRDARTRARDRSNCRLAGPHPTSTAISRAAGSAAPRRQAVPAAEIALEPNPASAQAAHLRLRYRATARGDPPPRTPAAP